MRRSWSLAVTAGAVAVAIAGCGSASSGGPAKVVPKDPTTGLRGVALASASCHQPPRTATEATPVPASGVRSLILCPLAYPPTSPRGAKPTPLVISRSNPHFDPIVAALAEPDQPAPPTPQMCAAYADLPQLVIARTSSGAFALAIPMDSCDHYLPAAIAALTAARAATPMSTPGGSS